MKVYLIQNPEATWDEDDAMVVIAKDKRHAERRARWSSSYFKRNQSLKITEIDLNTEQVVLISNIGG